MTNTVRNVLLAIALLVFGVAAVHDGLLHHARAALEDVFIGCMVGFVVLRATKRPPPQASTDSPVN
jgi:Na+/phosphate symporter